ncbi:hypothetical protein Cgig2_013893 [Carnegiea gigantea]|uniref:NAC domain-containing protein n=1 Tax=Carnegiea gigantea TaxID=171969 RepID=A0A9Q1GLA6_9CARY|nr:hypothetical protein Cgig2_013893 [Carnegiea gigantea]
MEQEQVLPPGFRFYPTEEELITFYLYNKLHGHRPDLDRVIPSIDIYKFEPSQLPEREFRGGRPNRTTATGYWKATGSPCYVYSSSSESDNKVIGVRKTMVFYKGKAPNGKKTKWKMNEYKAIKQDDNITTNSNASSSSSSTIPNLKHEFSLCRVYVTTGCARAFDRRPPGTMLNIDTKNLTTNNNQPLQEVPGGTASSSSQNANATATMLAMESRSTDSSDSGGNDHTAFNAVASGSATSDKMYDVEMAEALEPLLDWEQLNWL